MKSNKPWHENDKFWETIEPVLFHKQRLGDASNEINQVLDLLGLEKKASIVDLGCGIGRHSLELARKGFAVTRVDKTAAK